MTIHDVVNAQLAQIEGQINAYQVDIQNLLPMLNNLQQQAQVLIAWLAANPA
jgi:hypothetical protein